MLVFFYGYKSLIVMHFRHPCTAALSHRWPQATRNDFRMHRRTRSKDKQ